jgi:hypothetical protein
MWNGEHTDFFEAGASVKLSMSDLSFHRVWFLALDARGATRAFFLPHVGLFPCLDLLKWESKRLPYRQDLEAYSFVIAANPVIALLPTLGELINRQAQRNWFIHVILLLVSSN